METVFIIIFIVLCFIMFFFGINREREENKKNEIISWYSRTQRYYPLAFSKYIHKYPFDTLMTWSDKKWQEEEANERAKERNRLNVCIDQKWVQEQQEFAQKSYELSKSLLPNFGRYYYNIDIPSKDENGSPSAINLTVWQLFPHGICLEHDLDYTNYKSAREYVDKLDDYKERGISIQEIRINYVAICSYIEKIAEGNKSILFLNDNIEGWTEEALNHTYSNFYRAGIDHCNPAGFKFALELFSDQPIKEEELIRYRLKTLKEKEPDVVIFVDAFTTNDKLKENCRFIFETLREKHPKIVYISILKCYDRDEMIALINKANEEAKQKQAEEEAKRLEEETKRKEEEAKIQEEKAKEVDAYDEYAKRYIDLFSGLYQPTLFSDKAKEEWTRLSNNFYYTWLFYYYPTTCEFEANEEEWKNRWLVWDFKNEPEKVTPSEHEKALNNLVPRLKDKLAETFGEKYLQYLTLVCVPASTKEKNLARYEEFSKRLCDETGMKNAFEHIHIIKDGVSKKDPNNESGVSTQPEVSFDKKFFDDKYVLLFDDIVTKGSTMIRYKRKLEKMHVPVVGGICIGKTKHERPME